MKVFEDELKRRIEEALSRNDIKTAEAIRIGSIINVGVAEHKFSCLNIFSCKKRIEHKRNL